MFCLQPSSMQFKPRLVWDPSRSPCSDPLVDRDGGSLAAEYTRGIAAALDEYQLSPGGGMVAACILEPVLQVLLPSSTITSSGQAGDVDIKLSSLLPV